MDKYMDERFELVQRALTSLIDSITKYTPSTTQASDLAAADRELTDGLLELQKHQNNQARLLELRREADALDAQIKSTVSLLWSTRREITATPTTSYPSDGPRHDFSYSDLLNYARRIARTTMPPPGVTNGVDLSAPLPATDTQATSSAEQTPVPATTNDHNPKPLLPVSNGTGTAPAQTSLITTGPSSQQTEFTTTLPPHVNINLLDGAVFFPWPAEDRIRNGALELSQRLVAAGVDPKGYDPEEEKRRREAERAEAERLEAEREAERRRREQERSARIKQEMAEERERRARAEAAGGAGQAADAGAREEKKQFKFLGMGMGDDEDDD